MRPRQAFLGGCLALALLLSGCIQPVYDTPPVIPQAAETATLTPIVAFESTPAMTPTQPSPLVTPTPPQPPSLYLQPSVINMAVGETTTVKVWVDGARRLNAILLELSFNPAYVQVEDADAETEGVQIAPGDVPQPVEVARNEVTVGEDGRVFYQAAQEPGTAVDGGGVVASIMLHGVAEGGSPLRFESVAAYDPEGNVLEITPLSDGLLSVSGGEAVPTSTAEPVPQPTEEPTAEETSEAIAAPSPAPPLAAGAGIYYVVQSGENLYRIGLNFGTTPQAIAAASNIPDPDQVQAGAMLLVPVAPPQGGYGYYVQPKDTVYSIARRFGMTPDQLVALNGIGADYHIETGQILAVTP